MLLIPVRQSVLAPAEVVPLAGQVVAAPLDGVIAEVLVKPNQTVKTGDLLLRFESTTLTAQADVAALQTAIATPQPEQRPVVLANLLLTEGLPLSATLTPLAAGGVADALWQAQDTLLVLDAVPLDALVDLLRQRKAAGTPVHHVSVYAPWVHDDNFLQGVQT
eukprot:gene33845-34782_t